MVTLTFTVISTGHEREVEGEIISRNPPVLEEPHENRPNWRVEDDGTVVLLSANTNAAFEFGEDADFPDYCLAHGTSFPTGYDHCPICREQRRIERQEQEMHQRRSSERMHPSVDAPRY